MTIDTQIRDLLADGLSPALPPLTADELEGRARGMGVPPQRAHRLLLLAACVALVAELADGLSGTWYLIAHPDDAMFETAADGEVMRARPAR